MSKINFERILIIGMGLIGSSLARAIKEYRISNKVYGLDTNITNLDKCIDLSIIVKGENKINNFSEQFDLILICTPLGEYKKIFKILDLYINKDTIVTDVGSTKASVINDYNQFCKNKHIFFIPSHPIAGLEKSGPEYGFSKLFENRFCILTPINQNNKFVKDVKLFWESIGLTIEFMNADHHDRVLAMTSHIPQLIAYSIVSTASDLESNFKDEIIKYSAAGFRDFTRLAGSDPVMWRDVYSLNKSAVLEMLERFTEDLSKLQKAIKNNDTQFLHKKFISTRKIRQIIEKLGQAGSFDPTENKKIK